MNIAIVQELLDVRRGGAETSTLEMAAALGESGHAVTILARGEGGEAADTKVAGTTMERLAAAGASRAAKTREFLRAVERRCREAPFDVVHAVIPCRSADVYQPRGGTYRETIERSLALTPGGLGRVLRRVGKWTNRRQRYLLALEHELLVRDDPPYVAALSEYVRRQVLTEFPGYPPDRAQLVFNAVDVEPPTDFDSLRRRTRADLGATGADRLVLFVAHNFRLKGLRELIAAVARGPRAWRLLVAGRDHAAPYESFAASLGVAERVRFVGPTADVRALYAAADVLAHPTWYDPCSRVVLEALCLGLPVVTTKWNGAAEAMRTPEDGAVISDPGDVSALAAALARVLGQTAGRGAPSAARIEHLSMRRHARELVALYERVRAARSFHAGEPAVRKI